MRGAGCARGAPAEASALATGPVTAGAVMNEGGGGNGAGVAKLIAGEGATLNAELPAVTPLVWRSERVLFTPPIFAVT